MVPGMNTNALESFNSIIWSIIPKTKYHGSRRTEIAVMLAILYQQEGKASIASIMSDLGLVVSADSIKHFEQQDVKRVKQKTKRKEIDQNRYQQRLTSALEQYTDVKSYHPGVCDAGAGPSADMMATPFIRPSASTYVPALEDYIVLPYGPKWYIAQIINVVHSSREVEVNFLYENKDGSYNFKEEDDPDYEAGVLEPFTLILMRVPVPRVQSITSTRYTLVFEPETLDKVKEKFNEWKQRKRNPKELSG